MDDIPRNDYSGADQENENPKALSSDAKASEKKLMDAVKKASGGNEGKSAGKTAAPAQGTKKKTSTGKKPAKKKAPEGTPKAGKTVSEDAQKTGKTVSGDVQKTGKHTSRDTTKSAKRRAASNSRQFDSDDMDLLLNDEDTSQAANESAARARRRAAAKRAEEERREKITRLISIGLLVIIIILAIVLLTKIFGKKKDNAQQNTAKGTETAAVTAQTDSTNAAGTGGTAAGAADTAADPAGETSAQPESTADLGYDPNNPAGLSDEVLADPRSVNAVSPYVTDWNMESNGTKTVYLTFDDGPSYLTEQFLDVLDQYGVKATFFVTNQSPEYSYLIAEAYQRGHTIGMHTSSHSFEIYKSEEDYFFDLQEIANVVHDQIGYVPCFIRFPGGSSNTRSRRYSEGIMAKLAEEVQARGYQYYDWNGECGDGKMLSAEEEVAIALDCSAENIIMLCHDGPLKEATLEALPGIIEGYQARGYVFAPIDRDTMVVHHEILN